MHITDYYHYYFPSNLVSKKGMQSNYYVIALVTADLTNPTQQFLGFLGHNSLNFGTFSKICIADGMRS